MWLQGSKSKFYEVMARANSSADPVDIQVGCPAQPLLWDWCDNAGKTVHILCLEPCSKHACPADLAAHLP